MGTKEEELKAEIERKEAEIKAEKEAVQKDLAEQRRIADDARQKAAKAEGMVEAMKTFQAAQAQTGNREWTAEQWEEFKEKTGISKEAITAIDNAFGAKLADVESKFEARARQAEERAKLAEDKYNSYEGKRNFESQVNEYLRAKPQYGRYAKEFNEFIGEFPEETRKDPAKLAKLFDKAEIYIRGKVGEKEMKRSTGGSERFGSDGGEEKEDEYKVDLSDLRSYERMTVEKILPTKEKDEKLKAHRHDMKGDMGVMISAKSEWDKYKK